MNKEQLRALLPLNKTDVERAQSLALLDYATVKPVAYELLRWVRTYRVPPEEAPVAQRVIQFFIRHADDAVEEVEKALRTSKLDHWKYAIVTQILPEWPRSAIEPLKSNLAQFVTDTGNPETALMALRLLAKHALQDKEWLRSWLTYFMGRMEQNLWEAQQITEIYFSDAPLPD